MYTEGLLLGFAEWMIGDQTRPDMAVLEQELIGRVHMKGTMEIRIAASRDGGFTWDRTVSREAWIPHGTEQDSYNRCVRLYTSPLRIGDDDWFYATVVNGDHGSGSDYYRDRSPVIQGGLYLQKHHRYVSLKAGNRPQILITRPMQVMGTKLQLNVDASHGEVRIGIGTNDVIPLPDSPQHKGILPNYVVRDRQGNTHLETGFHLEDCKPVYVDSIQHTVEWKDAGLESLQGKTVRLYILVQDANQYGFRWQ